MPIRTAFDRALTAISDDLVRLSSMTDQAISNALRGLVDRNAELAQLVSAQDAQLNDLRYSIEEQCYQLIATQQPNTRDLRTIVGTVSVATNLERIGDHAAGIARLTLRIVNQPLVKPLVDIPQMAELDRAMVRDSVRSFIDRNAEMAEEVVRRDDQVDHLHKRIYRELLEFMTRDANTIERATFLLWVSHNLERIGDRACNICERAIYVATGELKEIS